MFSQMRVSDVEGSESEVRGCLDDGVVGSIQVDGAVFEVSAAELLAGDVDNAVFAVSHENRASNGAHDEGGVFALVDHNLKKETG